MGTALNIGNLFTPLQPTISGTSNQDVRYEEFAPHALLKNFIHCYWQLRTSQPLKHDFIYQVVSDGCVDVLLELDQPQHIYVTGVSTSYIEFPLSTSFHYIGVRFLPSAFPKLFGIPAEQLTNRFEPLDAVVPKLASKIVQAFSSSILTEDIPQRFDSIFLKATTTADLSYDHRFFLAVEEILSQKGALTIQQIDTGISPRQLRRLFQYHLGCAPKTFSQIVRFQNLLRDAQQTPQAIASGLFYDAGYYDQAHFIKEFKHFYGTPPTQAFQR